MSLFSDRSGATKTEHALIAAGMAFAVMLAVLPTAFVRPAAVLVLLIAWGAAAWWLE